MSERRQFRIAALADLHFDETQRGAFQETFSAASRSANVLALCGDLTAHGRPEQMHALVEELSGVDIPVVAVLGNHDHEADVEHELADILQARGVHLLDGENVIIQGVGFAGTKGFAGGFGRGSLGAFGERLIKEFVQATIDEALKLENALRTLNTDSKVVLLHYSPVPETLKGEPERLFQAAAASGGTRCQRRVPRSRAPWCGREPYAGRYSCPERCGAGAAAKW
jgi:Icc-related predicted phosphoesterase